MRFDQTIRFICDVSGFAGAGVIAAAYAGYAGTGVSCGRRPLDMCVVLVLLVLVSCLIEKSGSSP